MCCSDELVLISGGIPEIMLIGPLILDYESALPPDLNHVLNILGTQMLCGIRAKAYFF
jgi:hypothetical protein